MMRILPFLPLLLLSTSLQAQQEVRLASDATLRAVAEPMKSKGARAGLQASGLGEEQQEQVLRNSAMVVWPVGLRTDSARLANRPYLVNYKAFQLYTYVEDSLTWGVLMVPARDNIHMPEELRPSADLFLVVESRGIKPFDPSGTRPEISRGPRWKNLQAATIVRTDDLYATYDLGRDQAARVALLERGLSEAELEAVIFRSHERNWPEGIDSFDERFPRLASFAKYKARKLVSWDDKVILVVPVEPNRKMPAAMRPYVDIYLIYAKDAVRVKPVKGKKR